jgi:ankyrin repeat protein
MATFYPPIDWTRHRLHAAAISANSGEVKRLISEGADVNEQLDQDINGHQDAAGSPLHVALRNCAGDDPAFGGGHRHLETVKVLLAAGADIRSRRRWEGTPLHDAARFGFIHIADLMISCGADVNSKEDSEGRTPLHLAAANDRLRMVEYLLSKGANIDSVAHSDPHPPEPSQCRLIHRDVAAMGMTPLQLAAREGHVTVVRRLLEAGASLNVPTAIDWAMRSKRKSEGKYDEIIVLLSSKTLQ